jgi:isoleucyl-tRNA synthetase
MTKKQAEGAKNKGEKRVNPFSVMEDDVLLFWNKNKIFQKSVDRDAPKGDYVFYDGPPFATGLPHYGHIVASIIKDVVPRFWTMNGYRVERKWGWDCHGLPIENIVEKELGSKCRSDVEKVGVAKFNELCRSKVLAYVDDWKKVIAKLGRWADMENDYKTMDVEFMESVWHVFKTMYEKDLVYKGYRSMHVCPRCETTLSQSEVTEGYKDVKDLSVTAKFELIDEPGTFILGWTTTPWTLIGNVALAVGDSIKYQVLSIKGEKSKFIIAEERVEEIFDGKEYKVEKELKGSELVGKAYKPLFNYYSEDKDLENRENGWKVYAGGFVTTEEGTGVVHIAPAFGDDDMALGKEHDLPFVQHLTMDGNFKKEVTDFPGLNVKPIDNHMSTDIEIIKYLAHNGLLFAKKKYEHSYPHCWRCDTPLLNYATSSWFVNVTKIKEQMLTNAKGINWSPEHIKNGRWGKWLEGARDWSISRQRFWASVMPIWECDKDCGERKVVGSVDELEGLSGKRVTDLHKHIVDEVTFECSCGGTMKRIPDVLDTWFDSGSMPFAQMHYPFENKEKFEQNFPAEFIAEGTDQTRCWFYYMHVLATGTKNTNAFNNVIVNGIVLAEDGKKMSKKLQNYPDPMLVFDQYGADALRYYLLISPVMLADNFNFTEKGVSDALRKINMTLWNVVRFYSMFEEGEMRDKTQDIEKVDSTNVLDEWILARLDQLIAEVTEGMKAYNLPAASRPIAKFIDDLSTWYIRRSRDRFKGSNEVDKDNALATTRFVLLELSKVMAPFTPFIAEQVWQKITGNNFEDKEKSVHLEEWAKEESRIKNQELKIIEEMEQVRKIVELGLAKRDEAGMKVRQPLNELKVKSEKLKVEELKKYSELILDEVNVKSVDFIVEGEEISVELDLEITEDLKIEGMKRELVRFINSLRKNAGLTINDKIDVCYDTESEIIKTTFEKFGSDIMSDTLADEIKAEVSDTLEFQKEIKANGEELVLGVVKK